MISEVNSARVFLRCGGFSLVEVLVAFAVLALVVGTILNILGNSLRSVSVSGDYSRAVLLAQSKLDELSADELPEGDGLDGELGGRFRWHIQINPYLQDETDNGAPVAPLLASVLVSWTEGSSERSVTLRTVLLKLSHER